MLPEMPASEAMIAQIQPLIPALRRYARAMVRNRDDADDLVQDVLERAIAAWARRRPTASLRSWLFTILHNLALDHFRRIARRGTTQPLEDTPEFQFRTPARQEEAIEQARVLGLVARLPDEQRSVLLLVAVEELSYAEVAVILDVPQGTVMSRLSRARERLRRMMEDNEAASAPILRLVP